MNKLIMILYKLLIGSFIVAVIGVLSIPVVETINQEELIVKEKGESFGSVGDCRIVNAKLAHDNKYDIVYYLTKNNTIHVVAIEDGKMIHDVSKNTNLDKLSYKDWEEKSLKDFILKQSYTENGYEEDYFADISAELFVFSYYSNMSLMTLDLVSKKGNI